MRDLHALQTALQTGSPNPGEQEVRWSDFPQTLCPNWETTSHADAEWARRCARWCWIWNLLTFQEPKVRWKTESTWIQKCSDIQRWFWICKVHSATSFPWTMLSGEEIEAGKTARKECGIQAADCEWCILLAMLKVWISGSANPQSRWEKCIIIEPSDLVPDLKTECSSGRPQWVQVRKHSGRMHHYNKERMGTGRRDPRHGCKMAGWCLDQ